MPIYTYECRKCLHRFETAQKITEESYKTHQDLLRVNALPVRSDEAKEVVGECEGEVFRVIQPCGVIFKGSGWTPQFGRKTSEKTKKVDQALKAMGVEDASGGWTKADGKEQPKKKGKSKKIGDLKVD